MASASLRKALIGKMSFVGPRPDVPGYANKLVGEDRDVLKLRLEDEMISEYVAARRASGDSRPMQEIAVEYNDKVIYPDKVSILLCENLSIYLCQNMSIQSYLLH